MTEAMRQAIVQVCHDVFHWRSDVRRIFLRAGVPAVTYDQHAAVGNGKAHIARLVLDDLDSLGGTAAAGVEQRLIHELRQWDEPHRDAPDPAAGREALAEFKRLAGASADNEPDPEQLAARTRRERARQDQQKRELVRAQVKQVRDRFAELSRDRRRTPAELQQRGYDLEVLLADLFDAHKLDYRRPYSSAHEQHDGAFHFRGFTYIVEAKWQRLPPTFDDMAKFKFKVDGKMESVRGLLVAIAGFDDNVLDHLLNVARGSRNNLVLMDRLDLLEILEERLDLQAALTIKIDAAEQEGVWWRKLH